MNYVPTLINRSPFDYISLNSRNEGRFTEFDACNNLCICLTFRISNDDNAFFIPASYKERVISSNGI